jgi:hypothetical protein
MPESFFHLSAKEQEEALQVAAPSQFMEAGVDRRTSGTSFQFPNWKLSPTISPCKARTLRFS